MKKSHNKEKSLAIWCEANTNIGLGHFTRCNAIAEVLSKTYKWKIHFMMGNECVVSQKDIDSCFEVHQRHKNQTKNKNVNHWRLEVTLKVGASAVLWDINENIPLKFITELRKRNICIVTLDDPTKKRLFCDLAFYPPVPQVKKMNWHNFLGENYCGWGWVPLRTSLLRNRKNLDENELINKKELSLIISMGGSDPKGMIFYVLSVVESVSLPLKTNVLLGPAFDKHSELDNFLKNCKKKYSIYSDTFNVGKLFAEADLAIISYGVTAFEMALLGTPSLLICLTADHSEAAMTFDLKKISINLGEFNKLTKLKLASKLEYLSKNNKERICMAKNGFEAVDGLGVVRIAEKIHNKVKKTPLVQLDNGQELHEDNFFSDIIK